MSTRFYLPSSGAPAVSPAYGSLWETTASASRRPLVRLASGTALANSVIAETTAASSYDMLHAQFVSDEQLPARAVSGTLRVAIQTSESSGFVDAMLQMRVLVVSADGSTVRGELYAGNPATVVINGATGVIDIAKEVSQANPYGSRYFVLTLASVTAQAGDRLVVEVGVRHLNTTAGSTSSTLRFGDPLGVNGPISPINDDLATNRSPWVEFSQDLFLVLDPDVPVGGTPWAPAVALRSTLGTQWWMPPNLAVIQTIGQVHDVETPHALVVRAENALALNTVGDVETPHGLTVLATASFPLTAVQDIESPHALTVLAGPGDRYQMINALEDGSTAHSLGLLATFSAPLAPVADTASLNPLGVHSEIVLVLGQASDGGTPHALLLRAENTLGLGSVADLVTLHPLLVQASFRMMFARVSDVEVPRSLFAIQTVVQRRVWIEGQLRPVVLLGFWDGEQFLAVKERWWDGSVLHAHPFAVEEV